MKYVITVLFLIALSSCADKKLIFDNLQINSDQSFRLNSTRCVIFNDIDKSILPNIRSYLYNYEIILHDIIYSDYSLFLKQFYPPSTEITNLYGPHMIIEYIRPRFDSYIRKYVIDKKGNDIIISVFFIYDPNNKYTDLKKVPYAPGYDMGPDYFYLAVNVTQNKITAFDVEGLA